MSDRVTKVCVALPQGAAADADWLESLLSRAGCPVETVSLASLLAVCAAADADVVIVTEAVSVPDAWLVALAARPAALAVGTVAATPVAVLGDDALARAASAGLDEPPATAVPDSPCALLTAEALELVGVDGLDTREPTAFVIGFARRCAEHGLTNLVSAGAVVGTGCELRDPDDDDPAEHARSWARARALGPEVTIDARSLVAGGAGTQVHTLELVRALAGREQLRLRIVLPPRKDIAPGVLDELSTLGGLDLKTYSEVVESGVVSDVVHRPFQVFTIHDLRLLQRLGRRIIVTQQDQLLYRNPGYFSSAEEWHDYRHVCRIALAWADRTVFFTEHARREALRDQLLEETQTAVVPIGIDRAASPAGEARRPHGTERLGDRPFLLVLGTDLAHKNRPFAIRLLRALRADHGWPGALVLAGPHAEYGSSRAEEQPLLDENIILLDRVAEPERRWLLEHSSAVAFPSVEEGFGLMPFEAGEAGVPCLFAAVGAMAETLPPAAATIVPWDPAASAARGIGLLAPGTARDEHLALLRSAAAGFRWAATADRLHALYDEVIAMPRRHVAPIVAAEVEHQRRYEEFRARTGDDAFALLGPDGFLPPEMLRPLLAVTSRPALRRPLFALLRLLYRAGHR